MVKLSARLHAVRRSSDSYAKTGAEPVAGAGGPGPGCMRRAAGVVSALMWMNRARNSWSCLRPS